MDRYSISPLCAALLIAVMLCYVVYDTKTFEPVKRNYTIEMKLVDGSWVKGQYTLPNDAAFSIHTYRGSYSLDYNSNQCISYKCHGTIRNGVIDWRVK